jgi:hypothetical protein
VQSQVLKKPIFLAVLLTLLILGSAPGDAQEATPPPLFDEGNLSDSFEFYPADTGFGSYFDVTVAAGASATLKAIVANTGDNDLELRTYAINASTKEGGGFLPADYGTPPNDVTSWLNYPEQSLDIPTGKGIEQSITVHVPDGTKPGQYIAAIAAENADPSAIGESKNFTQQVRYVIPISITIPGDVTTGFNVGEISVGAEEAVFLVHVNLENTGDVRVRPEGTVDILDMDGDLLISFPVKMQSIYAHDETRLTLGTSEAIAEGPYQIKVHLIDLDTGSSADADVSNIRVETTTSQATPVPVLISITSAAATPKPAADNVQFVQVEATIQNSGDPVANAQLSLVASKDGAEVERFPISQSLSLPTGDTPISTRYLPADGWTTGTWTFELLLESVDPSGAAVVLGRLPVDGTVTIP